MDYFFSKIQKTLFWTNFRASPKWEVVWEIWLVSFWPLRLLTYVKSYKPREILERNCLLTYWHTDLLAEAVSWDPFPSKGGGLKTFFYSWYAHIRLSIHTFEVRIAFFFFRKILANVQYGWSVQKAALGI